MSSRTINNPGIELNEIDRSSYDKVDNSLPNSPISYVMGFADKGQDMTIEWINSKATLDNTFGTPTTEFESYLYNAAIEILNRGGSCIASKLPYINGQYQKYNYVDFDASQLKTIHPLNVNTNYNIINDIHNGLSDVLFQLDDIENIKDIESIDKMAQAIIYLNETYLPANISKISESTILTINNLSSSLAEFIQSYMENDNGSSFLYFNDSNLTSYIDIVAKQCINGEYGGKSTIQQLDDYVTQHCPIPTGTIRIYDITRAQYSSVENYNCVSSTFADGSQVWTNDCLGIIPVIVTPANAMYFQNVLNFNAAKLNGTYIDYEAFNSVSSFATIHNLSVYQSFKDINDNVSLPIASYTNLVNSSPIYIDSVSKQAASQFPAINFYNADHFDNEHLKDIGIVVFKAFKDTSNGGKIGFQLVESFVGSLSKKAKDSVTGSNKFIDDVVNSSSQFILMFSNVDQNLIDKASTFITSRQPAVSIGFYKIDCLKNISLIESIINPVNAMLDKASNANLVPIDIVVDAGMSNIAQLAKIQKDGTIHTSENPNVSDYAWSFNIVQHDISGWKAVISNINNFCKSMRKDCIYVVDGLRPLCIEGNSKIIRVTAPEKSVSNTIIPNFKYMAHVIDSSYAAGYCNWFLQQDYGRPQNYIWIPPSIKAAGVYTYCDTYFHPWSAPAGNIRGIVNDVVDVAFLPSDADAGVIYSNSWNYAMSYPINGIVIEGHKTFQTQRTALDRVNVRRMMLNLEKSVAQIARHFVYEQNTAYMRQQFVDMISPVLQNAVAGSGISEYAVKCDEELNTQQVIDSNEMRCKIAVKPVKVVDWIVIDFICTNQSVSVSEEVMR